MGFCDTVSSQVSLILPLACELAVGSAKCFSRSSGFPMVWGYTACGLCVREPGGLTTPHATWFGASLDHLQHRL